MTTKRDFSDTFSGRVHAGDMTGNHFRQEGGDGPGYRRSASTALFKAGSGPAGNYTARRKLTALISDKATVAVSEIVRKSPCAEWFRFDEARKQLFRQHWFAFDRETKN